MLWCILVRFFLKYKSSFRFILIEFKLNFSLAFVTWCFGAGAGSRGAGRQHPPGFTWTQNLRSICHALSKWHVWSNSIRATGITLVYSEWTLNHVFLCVLVCSCFLFVFYYIFFKLLLQTRSIEPPTDRAAISFPLDYARSLCSAVSLGWCKSGGAPGVQPWLRGPHAQRHTGVFCHASRSEFNRVGHPTCAAATFATSVKTHARNMLPLFTQMF